MARKKISKRLRELKLRKKLNTRKFLFSGVRAEREVTPSTVNTSRATRLPPQTIDEILTGKPQGIQMPEDWQRQAMGDFSNATSVPLATGGESTVNINNAIKQVEHL